MIRILPRRAASLSVACLAVVLWAGPLRAAGQAPPRHEATNVILVSLQCLRPDHLGVYGYTKNTSPNIDRLAGKAVLFENAVAQANLTPVAQMSVLTSQYPRVNGMVSFEVTPDMVSQRTMPEILKMYGYTTAAVTSSPEFFLRYDTEGGDVVNPGDVFSRSFDHFGRTRKGPGGRSVRKIPEESLQWIDANKDKKFFLWIASGLLHMPYGAAVPEERRAAFDPPGYSPFWKTRTDLPGEIAANADPDYGIFSHVHKGAFHWGFAPAHRLTEADVAYVNARYDAGVQETDLFIGRLMETLDRLGLTDKTLIVLQSIHGDDLGERGEFFHYDVTDTVIKNALLMRFPKAEFGGRKVAQQVQGIDILPTVLAYLDIPPPHEAQGGSLLPLLKGETSSPPAEFAYIDRMPWWEYNLSRWYLDFQYAKGADFAPAEREKLGEYKERLKKSLDALDGPPGDIAIRTNEWKLMVRKNVALLNEISWWRFITGTPQEVPEVELFDLKADPQETTNVAAQHPEVVARLKEKLLAWDQSIERRKVRYSKDAKKFIIPYP